MGEDCHYFINSALRSVSSLKSDEKGATTREYFMGATSDRAIDVMEF
jgi:hypothetical protein